MKKQIQHYLLLLLLLLPLGIQAQKQFPIYVTPTLTPPYSLNLSEYANFGSQKLMVIMQVNDLDIQNYPVKLHIKLETAGVTIETSPTIATTPIYLDGGATTMLFGEDLADYFNIDNLTFKGCSKQDYLRTGQLPEGFYRITVEALHYTKMVPISNAGIASAWMVVGKPPVLRNPRNAAELGQLPGSALTFSWLSSNVGNPTAAGNIQYTFEMWELRIPGINPNSVTVMAPFYEETTYATMLPVYPAILSLEPGMDYAWRVTASDASGMVPFEQEGHSELRTFTYSSRCDAASSLTAKKIGSSGTFRWDSEPNHTSYNVEMKNPNTGWSHEGVTYQEKAEFHDLTPGSIYELRVQSVCNSDPNSTSDFTDWVTLTIPESKPLYDSVSCPNCGCGDVTDAPELTNFTLRDDLQPGDTIINQRGTTRFIIKSVDNEGGTTYTGEFLFWAEIWGLKFICEYWDLQVNTDNVIVGMDFESVYDPQFLLDVDAAVDAVDELLGAVDVLTDSDIKDTLTYDGEMTSVYVDKAGNVMAVSEDFPAGQIIAKASDNENTLITNADGEAFVVSRDGEVMGVAEYQASGGGKSSKIKENNAEKEKNLSPQTVTFAASEGQKYGFDSYDDSKINIQSQYLPLQNGYRPAYKSVPSYSTDVVTASTYDDIIFKDEMGIPPMQSSNGLTIRGGADGAEVALYAYVDSTQVAGKLKIKSYDQDDNKVHIVSINGAELPSQGDLTKELNRIYGQAVVTWQVNPITLSETVEYDDDNVFNHGGTSKIAVYNKDQKAVVTAFKDAGHTIDQDAYYLFFIKDVEDKERNIGGYMPLSYHVGFIYDKPNNSTIAHELGHGAFSLWHTFSGDPVINATEGNTQNLMDYNLENPTELWSYQWDAVHDPAGMALGFLQDESEGEAIENYATENYYNVITRGWQNYGFLSASGQAIIVNNIEQVAFNEDGGVNAFILENGIKYRAQISKEQQLFLGYLTIEDAKIIQNNGGVYSSEIKDKLNDKWFKDIVFAPKGTVILSYAKQKDGENYLDCLRKATWKNETVASNYTGIANPPFIPEDAISLDISGSQCVNYATEGVHDGVGKDIFLNLKNVIIEEQKPQLVELANYFTDSISEEKFAFYGYGLEDYYSSGVFNEQIILYLKNNMIYSKDLLKENFPYVVTQSRDFGYIFSTKDLWANISASYNSISKDYIRGGLYEYSFADLKVRNEYLAEDNIFKNAIVNFEKTENAQPISNEDGYKQYVAKYGTDAALYSWAEFVARSSKDVMIAFTAYRIGPQLIAEVGVDAIMNKLIKEFGKEELENFIKGAVIEATMYYCAAELFDSDIDWSDFTVDVIMGGLKNTSAVGANAQVGTACLQGIDLGTIREMIAHISVGNIELAGAKFASLSVQCAIPALFERFLGDSSSKLYKASRRSTASKIVGLLEKLKLPQTVQSEIFFVIKNIDELAGNRGSTWKIKMKEMIPTEYGPKAYDLLIDARFDISRLSWKNFDRLKSVVAKLDGSEMDKLTLLFKGDLDVNRMLIYLEKSGSTITQFSAAMDDIATKGMFSETITLSGGKTMSQFDFLTKHIGEGDNLMNYYHKESNGMLYLLKVDPITEQGVEIVINTTSKIAVNQYCRFLTSVTSNTVVNYLKEEN